MLDGYLDPSPAFNFEHVLQKIVHGGRGGGCTQMNGLFARALEGLGFEVQRTLAKPYMRDGRAGLATHMALLVIADGKRWLCDVGFGFRGPIVPLLLDQTIVQRQGQHKYRVHGAGSGEWRVEYGQGDSWQNLLVVRDADYDYEEFRVTHYYNTHAPTSLFANTLVCARPRLDGGDYLCNGVLICRRGKHRATRTVCNIAGLIELLNVHFEITLSADRFLRLPPGIAWE